VSVPRLVKVLGRAKTTDRGSLGYKLRQAEIDLVKAKYRRQLADGAVTRARGKAKSAADTVESKQRRVDLLAAELEITT
jgi:hypothetical protein